MPPFDIGPGDYDEDGRPQMPDGQPMVACYVIGGCANGTLLPSVVIGAERIELKRPTYIKPIASALQKVPEIANESDIYCVHPIALTNDDGKLAVMSIAVLEGQSLEWGFKQLVVAHSEKTVATMRAAGLSPPGTKPSNKH